VQQQSPEPRFDPTLDPISGPGLRPGVVIRVDRGAAVVADGDPSGPLVRAQFGPGLRRPSADGREEGAAGVCTGDRVTWQLHPGGRITVNAVEPRRTLLTRASASGTSVRQLLAANIDVVAVTEGLMPDPDLRRLARLLALAWSSGAQPIALLTKADLVPDAAQFAAEVAAVSVCPVITVSAVTGEGVEEVAQYLTGGRTLALLGASGAGKSSLINALAGGDLMRVQALRRDGKGRHTTVTRELHRVGDGWVIDGPGLRGVGLDGAEGLEMTFADVLELAQQCRFRDCEHRSEPGCAVLAAVDSQQLDRERLDSWRQLQAEGYRQELRRDNRLRAAQNRQQRVMTKALRRQYNRS
jgi:ribosome biogenesis GTPase